MKECKSSSAAFRGASFGKWFHYIRLSVLVCFILSQNPASMKLFPYIRNYTSKCLLAGGKVLEQRYPSRRALDGLARRVHHLS